MGQGLARFIVSVVVCLAVSCSFALDHRLQVQAKTEPIARPDVQAELKITPLQAKAIEDELTEQDIRLRKYVGAALAGAEASPKDTKNVLPLAMSKANNEHYRTLLAILSPDQQTRFKEIVVQLLGEESLFGEAFRPGLDLSDKQVEKISAIECAAFDRLSERFREGFEAHGKPDPDEIQDFQKKDHLKVLKQIADVLTDDQKTKFKSMAGTLFKH